MEKLQLNFQVPNGFTSSIRLVLTASRTNPIKCLVLLGFHGVNHRLVLIFPRQSALKRAMVFGFCIGPSEISTLLLESDAKKTL